MRIVVLSSRALESVELLAQERPDIEWIPAAHPNEVQVNAADAVFGWHVPDSLVTRLKGLRWVQWWGAGVDRALGIPSTILLTRMVGTFTVDMSEYVLACLLDWVKQFPRARDNQRRHVWEPYLVGRLAGKQVGVAGSGSIGGGMGDLLVRMGVGVHMLATTERPLPFDAQSYGKDRTLEFLSGLDALVLVMPLTDATHHFLNAEKIEALPSGAAVVNVGRGGLIDEPALLDALDRGHLSRAYLDVVEEEPLPSRSPLWSHPRVAITPHISGPSRLQDIVRFSLDNLARWERHEPMVGVVDRRRGY